MGIQTIIDRASFITVDKKKLASQTISRSGKLLTAEVTSNRPYRFVIGVNPGYSYSGNRDLLEELDSLDITTEENVDIGSTNTGLGYITELKGSGFGGTVTVTSAYFQWYCLSNTTELQQFLLKKCSSKLLLRQIFFYPSLKNRVI